MSAGLILILAVSGAAGVVFIGALVRNEWVYRCALLTLSGDNRDCPESDGALAALALTAAALRSAATLARETEAGS